MHRPTLVKLAVGVVLILLVVIATFWYGNAQRNAQTKQNTSPQPAQNSQQLPNTDQAPKSSNDSDQKTEPAPSTAPAQPATPTPAQSQPVAPVANSGPSATMPSTGGELSIVPLTILATLAYMYVRSRPRKLYK